LSGNAADTSSPEFERLGMPRNDRRNAHRYSPARDCLRLGWWEGKRFRTISAGLHNLSITGALIQMEEDGWPGVGKVWISLCGQEVVHWVQAEILEASSEPEGPRCVRMKFPEPFPYEVFKAAVWGESSERQRPGRPGADEAPPAFSSAGDSAQETRNLALSDVERIRFFLELDSERDASSRGGPSPGTVPSPHPPTLVEAQRSQMLLHDRIAPLSWLMVTVISLAVSVLLALLAAGHFMNVRRLGIILGLTN
jgi:hypothetical protein